MSEFPEMQVGCTASSGSSSENEDAPAFIIVVRRACISIRIQQLQLFLWFISRATSVLLTMRSMQADASPVMMAALQALADLECGYKLIKRSQLVGKKFRPVVDLQWLPHSLVDWQLVLDGGSMCNHFCARSALVRKAELYQLLQNARGRDLLPVTPATFVLVLPHDQTTSAAHRAVLTDRFCEQLCSMHSQGGSGSSERKVWLLKAGNSSNGNDIHMVSHLEQVRSLLHAQQPRGCWCVQEFVSDAALVHGCRYSVRLLLLLASSQAAGRPCFSAWAFRRPMVLRCLLPFSQAHNQREYLSNSQGDSAVIRDCAFLFDRLPELAACGAATSFDVHECLQFMCEHAAAAVSAAVAAIIPVPRCFEVFAADFIVDCSGRPWLLEVNADPSWALWEHEQPALQEFVFAALRLARAGFACSEVEHDNHLVQLQLA